MQVTEKTIDKITAKLDQLSDKDAPFNELVEDLQEEFPFLFSYIFSDQTKVLTEIEREYFLFIAMVIVLSVKETLKEELPEIAPEKLEQWEDKNWETLQMQKAKGFAERITVFYENYPEEDLLAFIEDFTVPDEDQDITPPGREVIFIMSKTIVDGFFAEDKPEV